MMSPLAMAWLIYASYNGAMVVHLTEIVPVAVRTAGFSLAAAVTLAGILMSRTMAHEKNSSRIMGSI
jgi:hypothetical protein